MGRTLTLVLGLLTALPVLAAEPAARVTFLEGPAERLRAGTAAPLAPGEGLEVGDEVQTGAGARLEILLADGSVLRLDASSRVVLDELTPAEHSWSVRLSLALGSVWAKVTRRVGERARFEVRTERVVAGVRGTEFLVEAKAEHLVEVFEGRVEVGLVEGGRFRLSPTESLRIDARGKTPGIVAGAKNALGQGGFRGWIRPRDGERLEGLKGRDADRLDGERSEDEERKQRRGERKQEVRQRSSQKRELIRERLRERLRR